MNTERILKSLYQIWAKEHGYTNAVIEVAKK